MQVKLVAITKPLIDGINNAEEFIAYAARVSNPDNQLNNLTAPKLINYLIKHHHWSPLEMVNICMEIETTRDIARQIIRHRSFSFQEFSQRYAEALGFSEPKEARTQDLKNRQNSVKSNDDALKMNWFIKQKKLLEYIVKEYKWALENGIAKEVARIILPEGLTTSRLYMSGSFRSWYHYCKLRMANGTQLEHQDIAKACWAQLEPHFPNIKIEEE